MTIWKHYLLPKTLDDALTYLNSAADGGRVISGGTDLLLDIRQGRQPPVGTLVDITGIPELGDIHIECNQICLGSAVTHRQIVESSVLLDHAACLVEACTLIGGPQVRNVATIGGNVAHALPAADGSIALLALDAEAQIVSMDGSRWEKIEDLFLGPGKPSFDPRREILVRFRIPLCQENDKSAFHRVMRPQGVAIAILNMALWIRLNEGKVIEDIRLAVGPAGPIPFRARETEGYLRGKSIDSDTIRDAVVILQEEAKVRTSRHRSSKEYRKHLLGVLLSKVIS